MDRYAIITAVNMEAVINYSVINMMFIAEKNYKLTVYQHERWNI